MTILVVGASGATGKLLVEQLLNLELNVKVIIRSPEKFPNFLKGNKFLSITCANILDINDTEMKQIVKGCHVIVSCLGHNINLKGIFGQPRMLVTGATDKLCNAIKLNDPGKPIKYVLMNTTANSNRDLHEKISFGEKCVVGLLRLLLPPHVDNERAADYLRTNIGQHDKAIEWVAVRPDKLIDEKKITEFEVHPSPIRNAIFDSGLTSRINVSRFMADLITDDNTWKIWKGRMPVIYNKEKE